MVSPVFYSNLYAGSVESMRPGSSPVDLFHPSILANLETFPLLKKALILEVTLKPGECLFVPAWWWYQSQTLVDTDTIFIDFEFEPHSKMFNIINRGIQARKILEGDNEVQVLRDQALQAQKQDQERESLNSELNAKSGIEGSKKISKGTSRVNHV
mmetsp:Transcript_3754/g.5678  ORF Transcript_3754/g.5678 Transcript_3754/m.5678 type:complete len:156 (-) Transcript_3754:81-548(-)